MYVGLEADRKPGSLNFWTPAYVNVIPRNPRRSRNEYGCERQLSSTLIRIPRAVP
jgi:hypothetical protein